MVNIVRDISLHDVLCKCGHDYSAYVVLILVVSMLAFSW